MNGADASFSRVNRTWFDLHPEVEVFVQDAFTGGPMSSQGLVSVAGPNLLAAKSAGRVACFYTNVAPWHPNGRYCIEQAIRIAGVTPWQSADKILVIDVEIMEWDGLVLEPRIVWEAVTEAAARGFRPVVYTAAWCMNIWKQKLGHYPRLEAPIWYARYDNVPEIGDPGWPLYGQPVVGKQYGGDTVDGVTIDFNTFDLSFWAPAQGGGDWMADLTTDELQKLKDFLNHWQAPRPAPVPGYYPDRDGWTNSQIATEALTYLDGTHLITILNRLTAIEEKLSSGGHAHE